MFVLASLLASVLAPVLGLLDALDPEKLIETFGTIGVCAIVFAESGLFFGFFLPGDSLLVMAGVLSSKGDYLPGLPILLPLLFVSAAAGDQVGYLFGRRVGPALFSRPDSRVFKQKHLQHAQDYFEKQGSKAIVLARFVPVVRTFCPIVAGVSKMPYRTFVTFNLIGALVWACGVTTLGYLVGEALEDYITFVIIGVVVLSLVPIVLEVRKHRSASGELGKETLPVD
jgi:membrane-associated protein